MTDKPKTTQEVCAVCGYKRLDVIHFANELVGGQTHPLQPNHPFKAPTSVSQEPPVLILSEQHGGKFPKLMQCPECGGKKFLTYLTGGPKPCPECNGIGAIETPPQAPPTLPQGPYSYSASERAIKGPVTDDWAVKSYEHLARELNHAYAQGLAASQAEVKRYREALERIINTKLTPSEWLDDDRCLQELQTVIEVAEEALREGKGEVKG